MALQTPWPICATCEAIPPSFFRNDPVEKPHQLWPTFSAFADSAYRGCHTCTLLFEAVREPFKHKLDVEPVYLECAAIDNATASPTVIVGLTVNLDDLPKNSIWDKASWKQDGNQPSKFQFVKIADVKFVTDGQDVPQAARNFKNLISLYAEDEGVFRYIKQSLATCLEKHSKSCNRVMFPVSTLTSQLHGAVNIVHGSSGLVAAPTRLINVGSDDPKDPPRLVDGQECLRKGGYIALSYCWGLTPKDAPWRLTSASTAQFATEIPLVILPQTLHDSFLWTRNLGYQYIWIDSMCIQQDDGEDWQKEASRMASIYGSATMTIVATSTSVYGGITDLRNPLRNSGAELCLQDASSNCTIYILPNGQPRNTTPRPPTESRGWCYQEDLLSSRLVKMTQKQVVWQCVSDGENSAFRAQGLEQLTKHPPFRWYTLWYRLIERYSNMSLSYPKDRLSAFYGIACDKIGNLYFAGLIKSDPWASLLWCRDENQIRLRPGRRFEEYVAPTWSWASIDVPVLFYEASARHWRKPQVGPCLRDPELRHVEVQPVSYIDTGAVKGGSIEISAYIAITRTVSVEPFLFNTRQGSHTYGRRNCVDLLTGKALGLIVFDVATEARDDMLLCCALFHTADMSLWLKNGTAGLGLALSVQEATAEHFKCKRVGYVQFTPAFSAICYKRRVILS